MNLSRYFKSAGTGLFVLSWLLITPPIPAEADAENALVRQSIEQFKQQRRDTWSRHQNPQFERRAVDAAVPVQSVRARLDREQAIRNLLTSVWGEAVSSDVVQAEINRMARDTKAPETLQALFGLLGNDPRKVAAHLARPRLEEHAIRQHYAFDSDIHRLSRKTAQMAVGPP